MTLHNMESNDPAPADICFTVFPTPFPYPIIGKSHIRIITSLAKIIYISQSHIFPSNMLRESP